MSYMLIQAGFPIVNNQGQYLGQLDAPPEVAPDAAKANPCHFPKDLLPKGDQQTRCVLEQSGSNAEYGTRFVVQHNGLNPLQCDKDGDGVIEADEKCPPNYLVLDNQESQIVGFQTTNSKNGVSNSVNLEEAFQNGYCNSAATFFEIYEERLWEVRQLSSQGVLDSNAGSSLGTCKFIPSSNRTLGDWADMLHAKRTVRGKTPGLGLFPVEEHRHTFKRTINASVQTFTYVHGSKCRAGKEGVVTIVPDITTRRDSNSQTRVAGYDQLGPAHKPTPATVHALPAVTTNEAIALRGISLAEAANASCALSLSFQALPGQTEQDTSLDVNASLSGPATCQSSSQLGLAKFDDGQHFVHGLRVCTSGAIPRVQGIEIYAAKVNEDGTVSGAGASERFAASGCSAWSPTRFCPAGTVAVGVLSYFTDGGGFSGIALQCKALQAL
jgi:hypothetical protein